MNRNTAIAIKGVYKLRISYIILGLPKTEQKNTVSFTMKYLPIEYQRNLQD